MGTAAQALGALQAALLASDAQQEHPAAVDCLLEAAAGAGRLPQAAAAKAGIAAGLAALFGASSSGQQGWLISHDAGRKQAEAALEVSRDVYSQCAATSSRFLAAKPKKAYQQHGSAGLAASALLLTTSPPSCAQALEGLAFHDSDPSARRAASWVLASACQAARQARSGAGPRSQPRAGAAEAGRQQISLQQAAAGLPEDGAMRCLLDQIGQCELRCLDAGCLTFKKHAAHLDACMSVTFRPEEKLDLLL